MRFSSKFPLRGVDARLRVRAHERIRLAPSPAKIHLFDPATERALLS